MNKTVVSAGIGFALGATALLASPARAAEDYRCAGLAEQARAAVAQVADPASAERLRRRLATGDQLCAARARGEAADQYRAVLRSTGVREVRADAADRRADATTAAPGAN